MTAQPRKFGRNDPCPCGSGKKYKKCCANKTSVHASQPVTPSRQHLQQILRQAEHHYAQGNLQEAAHLCQQLLAHNAKHPEFLLLMGRILNDAGKHDKAVEFIEQAIKQHSTKGPYYFFLSKAYGSAGHYHKGVKAMEEAIKLEPHNAAYFNALGAHLMYTGDTEAAKRALYKAIELDASLELPYRNLILTLHEAGQFKEAEKTYTQLLHINPNNMFRIAYGLAIPKLAESNEHIDQIREELNTNLDRFMNENIEHIEDPIALVKGPLFYLAYHGKNDRELLTKHAHLFQKLCPLLRVEAPHCKTPEPLTNRKIRIGFLSRYFYRHPVGICFNNLITALTKDPRFEITLITAQSNRDDETERLIQHVQSHVSLPPQLRLAMQSIERLQLDTLVYTDIGMNNFTYFLAFARLALNQCCMVGHPNTTGSPTMDYFITSKELESEKIKEQYSETPILLDHIPLMISKPSPIETPIPKAEIGLPEERNIYLCPMTLQKIHPDFDHAIADIIRGDPEGVIILQKDTNYQEITKALQHRFNTRIPDATDRIRFVDWLPTEKFLHRIIQSDVILDPFHFGGGTTAYNVFAYGTPIITWPGEFMRGALYFSALP